MSCVNYNFDQYEKKFITPSGNYIWTDSFNSEINTWCQKHICNEMYFAFQIMKGDGAIHKDIGTKTKFCYLLDTGGDAVYTRFYDEDQITEVDSVRLEIHRWHMLKVDSYHGVSGIESGKVRFSITGKIF